MSIVRRRTEAGSSLVIALVFLSLFALWIAATLSSASGALKVTQTMRTQRPLLYAADGAVQQAIQQIRNDSTRGKDDGTSCDSTATLNGVQVFVKCTPQPRSGLPGVEGGSSPTLGILTLATGTESGYQQASNDVVRINGGLYSNSRLTQWGGSKSRLNACPPSFPPTGCTPHDSAGTVTVQGACEGGRIIAEVLNCNQPHSTAGDDPNYPVDQSTFNTTIAVPPKSSVCPGGSTLVMLSPGRYNNAGGLSALTNDAGCGNSLLWFQPGTYYFDFKDNPTSGSPTPCSSATTCTWSIDAQNMAAVAGDETWPARSIVDGNLTGGSTTLTSATANFTQADVGRPVASPPGNASAIPPDTKIASVTNASTAVMSRPATSSTIQSVTIHALPATRGSVAFPGSCNADTLLIHPGVEFVFGGTSRLALNMGKLEICSPVQALRQQIAVYGVKSNPSGGNLTPQSGCITATGYVNDPDTTHCAMILTGGNKAYVMVHGTIYAPAAALDFKMNNVTYQVVTRGIIARVLAMHVTPSSDFAGAFISSPGFGSVTPGDREVALTACSQQKCDQGGAPRVRALVKFHDTPSPGSSVSVESWSVVR